MAATKPFPVYVAERAIAEEGIATSLSRDPNGAVVQSSPFPYEPITNFGAISGEDCTAALTAAVASKKLLYIPAGEWSWTGQIASEQYSDVMWIIDPGASFPNVPVSSPHNFPDLSSLGGRIFWMCNLVGAGTRLGSGKVWPEDVRPASIVIAELSVVNPQGLVAILGASRTSDNLTANMSTISLYSLTHNDNEINREPAWGSYIEVTREPSAGSALGIEVDVVNKGATTPLTPYSVRSLSVMDSICLWVASGAEVDDATTASAGMAILNNGAKFERGIVIMNNALEETIAEAMSMPQSYNIAWYDSSNLRQGYVSGTSAQFTIKSDVLTDCYETRYIKKRANGTDSTRSGDEIFADRYLGWNGSDLYFGAYSIVHQRTDFSGANARFSYAFAAKNSDGSYAQMGLNNVGDNTFGPDIDNTISIGTSSLRPRRVYGVTHAYTASVFDTYGTGSPEGVVTASVGSTYRRTDGGASSSFYVKESGNGNTGWVAK